MNNAGTSTINQQQQILYSVAEPLSSTSQCSCWNETAHDWMVRSHQEQCIASSYKNKPPIDPSSAAWSFVRPCTTETTNHASTCSNFFLGGCGISFIDAVLSQKQNLRLHTSTSIASTPRQFTTLFHNKYKIPVIDLRGDVGKTWTLITLAAKFVVSTRPSIFTSKDTMTANSSLLTVGNLGTSYDHKLLPQVILLDSNLDLTIEKIVYAVRASLIRAAKDNEQNNITYSNYRKVFENDMNNCLGRIHKATPSNDSMTSSWITVLESIRCQLLASGTDFPTLILWDGYLSEPDVTDATKMEIVRQLELLINECCIFLVVTTSTAILPKGFYRKREWERFVTHRIQLNHHNLLTSNTTNAGDTDVQHPYVASVNGLQFPFSISLAGILS